MAAADQAAADSVAEDAAVVEAAGEATAASLAESLATVAAADEVAAEATGEAEERVRAASITMAEAQVLRYLSKPLPFAVIADKLGISRSAAKERAARLYKRLGVHGRDEAVAGPAPSASSAASGGHPLKCSCGQGREPGKAGDDAGALEQAAEIDQAGGLTEARAG